MLIPKTPLRAARLLMVVIAALSVVVGCASNQPQINMSDEQNFDAIDTFYVQVPLNSVNPAIDDHMVTAISSVLQSRGLKPASKENADIEVGYFPTVASKEGGASVNIGLGTGVFGRSSGISLGSIFSVPVGEQVTQYQNLQIDIVKDGAFIYSAVGSVEIEAQDSITVQQELTKLVSELLQSYPVKMASVAEPE
ncbi:DUF4136 domain-containing protein [Alteromonas aestuariivivens]|uniref:DUF4136 domain-containing protein n=1 Tax=Alteromonas aestuariivivens TaxID=1938339 RepID=A0A3D8MF93_9ALTE|nr:DUF4136 domain-containing protein [Alteromonas aestuariivivens]RDV29422.1 DUF4136 domain-containing protein [Alteromonas aestuariivivens]